MRNTLRLAFVLTSLLPVAFTATCQTSPSDSRATPEPRTGIGRSAHLTTGAGTDVELDAQIARTLVTITDIEIAFAKLATEKSRDKSVLGYAHDLLETATEDRKAAEAKFKSFKATPPESNTAQKLQESATAARAKLAATRAAGFDKAFLEQATVLLQEIQDTFDKNLSLKAKDGDLDAMLSRKRERVARHLELARKHRDAR